MYASEGCYEALSLRALRAHSLPARCAFTRALNSASKPSRRNHDGCPLSPSLDLFSAACRGGKRTHHQSSTLSTVGPSEHPVPHLLPPIVLIGEGAEGQEAMFGCLLASRLKPHLPEDGLGDGSSRGVSSRSSRPPFQDPCSARDRAAGHQRGTKGRAEQCICRGSVKCIRGSLTLHPALHAAPELGLKLGAKEVGHT